MRAPGFFVFFFLTPSFLSHSAGAEPIQDVTVSAEPVSVLSVGSQMTSNTIVTQEEIQAKQYKTVYEALSQIPGVGVVSTSPGQTVSVFVRGEKSEQTLVLVDGVEYNDPTDPGRGADLSYLSLENVERIEVIRGAQSVLYPGIGSVILITTKTGGDPKTSLSLEGGSYGTLRSELSTRGSASNDLHYSFGAEVFHTDGIPAVVGGTERDGSQTTTFSGKIVKDFEKKTKAELVLRYIDGKSDIDDVPKETPNNTAAEQSWLSRVSGTTRYGIWEPTLGFSLRTIDRTSLNFGSTPNTHFLTSGNIEKIDWINRLFLSERNLITLGVETERQHAKMDSNFTGTDIGTDQGVTQSDLFAQYEYLNDSGPYLTTGARVDYHSAFYAYPTVRFAPGWKIKETGTTFRTSMGTGFKAPSIYQLYGEYGNSALKPEQAFLFDVGFEQSLIPSHLGVIGTGFYNKLNDMVDYDFSTSRYVNIGKAVTRGVEISLELRLLEWMKCESQYTYMETQDEATGLPLLRRPRNQVTNSVIVSKGDWEGSLTHELVGNRSDLDATTFARIELPTYNLFNFNVSWRVFEKTKLNFRVDNLFDTRYVVIDGYNTPGLSVYGGVRQEL